MNFRDCFQIVRAEFSGSLGLGSGLVLISGLMPSGFMVCFGIIVVR